MNIYTFSTIQLTKLLREVLLDHVVKTVA